MVKQLDRHFLQLKFNLTRQLEQGPAELEKITREAHAEVDPLDAELAELEQEVAQPQTQDFVLGCRETSPWD